MSTYLIIKENNDSIDDLRDSILLLNPYSEIIISENTQDIFGFLSKCFPEKIIITAASINNNINSFCKTIKSNHLTSEIQIFFAGTNEKIEENYDFILESNFNGIIYFPINLTQIKLLFKAAHNTKKSKDYTESDYTETASLNEQVEIYDNLLERMPDGVYKSTHSGKFIEVNSAMVNMLGYDSREELLAIDIKKDLYFHPTDRESVILAEKNEEVGIFRLKKKDGSEIWVEDHGWYILDNEGQIIYHEGIMRDITERKQVELALEESEERFKMLFEKAPVCYQTLNENGNILDANEAFSELFGHTKEEVIGTNFRDFISQGSLDLFNKSFTELNSKGKTQIEFEIINKHSECVKVEMEARIGHKPDGSFKQIHCVFTDITERKKTEKLIIDEKNLLRTLIDNIPDPIYIKDKSAKKIISNIADLSFFNFKSEKEVIGKTDLDLFSTEAAKKSYADDLLVLSTLKPIYNKLEYPTNSKQQKRVISTTKIPLFNDKGEIIGLLGIGRDITDDRENRNKLNQLSKGLEQSPASIIITDINGKIEYVNKITIENSGYNIEEIIGHNSRIFQSGYTSKKVYEELWNSISSGKEYRNEILNRRKNGELYWESFVISPIKNDEGNIVNYIAIKEDITSRKKSELEILKLSTAIEQNPISVVITDTQGVIEYINTTFSETSGYKKEELKGKILRLLKPGHTSEETFVEIWNSLFAGKQWKGEQENRNKKGDKFCESVLISPLKAQDGNVTNFIVLSEDISHRKKMENDLVKAKEKAEESDRLKSAFLANMSHEIRTPLNSILGFSDLLNDENIDESLKKEFAGLINLSGNNLLNIINDVLDISKIEAGQLTINNNDFHIVSLLNDVQKEYSFKANAKKIELKISESSKSNDLILVSDEARIKQILVNYIGNALKFTENGYIELGFETEGTFVHFYVKDTGMGIDEIYHEKIFERFRQVDESHKRKFGGNGLGLAITKNLVELLGGKVWVESALGKGSTFWFSIPYLKI